MSKSLRDKARRVLDLSFSDWLSLIEAWWRLFGFYLALRVFSYERLKTPFQKSLEETPEHVLEIAQANYRLVGRASRLHLLPMTCLPRALTLRSMLGRRGIRSEVRLGARKTAIGLHAHAWVEVLGIAIGENDDLAGNFQVLGSR